MACTLSQAQIDKAVAFHGHWCPGLALGLRAAEWALAHFGCANDEDIVAVTETDMCAVDAVQALVGCTFGKGNLIYRDYGKVAFTFYRRKDGKAARLVKISGPIGGEKETQRRELLGKSRAGLTPPDEEAELAAMRKENIARIMNLPFEDVFAVKEPDCALPPQARLMETVPCADCGEGVMESRTRRLNGNSYCIPCFAKRDAR